MFVPPAGDTWTGRRRTVVKFEEDFPFGEYKDPEVDGAKPATGSAPKPQ